MNFANGCVCVGVCVQVSVCRSLWNSCGVGRRERIDRECGCCRERARGGRERVLDAHMCTSSLCAATVLELFVYVFI